MIGKLFRLNIEEGIGVVTFDVPGVPMNTWTVEANNELSELLDSLENNRTLKGVIFISGKPHNFHSGANLNFIESFNSREELAVAVNKSHRSFNRLHEAPFPSVAAIHGHCLGGGFEFALACTGRIAKAGKTTVIGLPECLVGLFPGGGGTQRLTRLIGLPAIELILKGKTLPLDEAYKVGMVDRQIPAEDDLLLAAKNFIKEIADGTAQLNRPGHDFSQVDAVVEVARGIALKASRGREILGPMLALKAIQEGVKLTIQEGLEIEKNYFLDVALSEQAKGSIHTFFLKTETDKPLSMVPRDFKAKPIRKAAVLGFGTMGRGIIIDILRHRQIPVVVKDSPEALKPGKDFVQKILLRLAEKKKLKAPVEDLMALLTVTSDYGNDFNDVDLVCEAVYEDLRVKDMVFKELCSVVPGDCIIASNTSSIAINSMAGAVTNPERFAGAHFFSPVWMMELLEIIKGEKTDQDTVNNLLCFAGAIKKRPVVCNDSPGFIVNALLLSYFLNMYALLEHGVEIEAIDAAMVHFGFPVGPVRLVDEIGIDVQYIGLSAMGIAPESLVRIFQDGRAGLKKSGKGFFLPDGSVDPGVLPLIAIKGQPIKMTVSEIQQTFYRGMVVQGKKLLDSGVVADPKLIDIAMIWGAGFPSDKGGPMKWADLTGLSLELNDRNFYRKQ